MTAPGRPATTTSCASSSAVVHPALRVEAQYALTLRSLGGPPPRRSPPASWCPRPPWPSASCGPSARSPRRPFPSASPMTRSRLDRIGVVHHVLYHIDEGAYASTGSVALRVDLAAEAIRLTRLLGGLVIDDAETQGLLALMLFTDARRPARIDAAGQTVLLADQDRGRCGSTNRSPRRSTSWIRRCGATGLDPADRGRHRTADPRAGPERSRHRLAPDRGALPHAGRAPAHTGRGTQPRRRRGRVRGASRRPPPARCAGGGRTIGRVPLLPPRRAANSWPVWAIRWRREPPTGGR